MDTEIENNSDENRVLTITEIRLKHFLEQGHSEEEAMKKITAENANHIPHWQSQIDKGV